MRVIIEFDLPTQQIEYSKARYGERAFDALEDIQIEFENNPEILEKLKKIIRQYEIVLFQKPKKRSRGG